MNEWFKKLFATIKEKWAKWTALQKGILIGIIVAVIAAIVVLVSVSSRDTSVRLFTAQITDSAKIQEIQFRLEKDNVWSDVRDGYIVVKDEATARRYRSKLIEEGLEPASMDPYGLFGFSQWSRNDFDDSVKWKQHTELKLKQALEALDDISHAVVTVNIPEESMFADTQKPTTASVQITPVPRSDILTSKIRVKGLQHLIQMSVEGLREENISIFDTTTGQEVNDFEGLEYMDRLQSAEREQRLILKMQGETEAKVLQALKAPYKDRVQFATMKIDMDMAQESSTAIEYTGIKIKEDNPNTSYDDSIVVESLVEGEELINKQVESTGYNPEGPTGVEGQNPPVMGDMSNVVGRTTEEGVKRNYIHNEKQIQRTESPRITRITMSVNIDSRYEKQRDKETNKFIVNESGTAYLYKEISLSSKELEDVRGLVRGAVGYNRARGDSVEVYNVPFDHQEEWEHEYEEDLKKLARQRAIMWSLIGVAVVLIAFILFRIISREVERRRRLREEEMLRKQQAEREAALWEAKNEGMEVTMSVEERKRAELQENAIALAKEHPEDVAMLIRTWLMEE